MGSLLISNAIPLPQLTIAAADIQSSYTDVGQFSEPVVMMLIISTLNGAVQVSFDGVNDHVVVPNGSTVPVFMTFDFKGDRCVLPDPAVLVKQIDTPDTGSLYITAFTSQIP